MKIAIIGVSGLVGHKMLEILDERGFPADELYPVASERSVGQKISFRGHDFEIMSVEDAVSKIPDVALFSAGASVSKEWAPRFAEKGTVVIDNSSAWRMEDDIKLVVPEINADALEASDKIIANPNCSTIQLVMALAPLHKYNKISRLVISTYQSVTGTGINAAEQLDNERLGVESERAYPHRIDLNVIPHCDSFEENGYTKEEIKLVNETRKIIGDDSIRITATAVRVPVIGGHSESVNIEFENEINIDKIKEILNGSPGVTVVDNIANAEYPMPINSKDKDDVFVGRIRLDESNDNCLNLWIVSDNLRKGAATNAIQIAEYLIQKGYLNIKHSVSSQ